MLTSPSGKSYIGITVKTVEKRFAKHVEHALGKRDNGVLYSAVRKYKPENFLVKTLVIANDWDYLCDLERKAIVAFKTRHPLGYNMTDGGEGVVGPKDEKTRAAIGIAQKKRFERPEERERLKKWAALGKEVLKKKYEANRIDGRAPWEHKAREKRSRVGSPEHRAKISAATKATMATPDVAAAMKRFAAERAANPEWRKKIGDSKRGKLYGKRSEEFVEKQVAGIKAAWADPVKKAQRLLRLAEARNKTKPHVEITCGNCSKLFSVPQWEARSRKPKYCSRTCWNEFKKRGSTQLSLKL
jgi:hypothetical protein